MRVVNLYAENFKPIRVVDVTPEGHLVTVGGKNGQGKSSVLDAIFVALRGRAANAPVPVRQGEERALIRLDLGDLVVTRTFTVRDGKVENADGLRYGSPQKVLDALLGEVGFDPFAFALQKPERQVATILDMVPLAVDLDELAEADRADFASRTTVNRDLASARNRLAAVPEEQVPDEVPDRDALTAELADAGRRNTERATEQGRRERAAGQIAAARQGAGDQDDAAAALRRQAADLLDRAGQSEDAAKARRAAADKAQAELDALPPLPEPVDAAAVQEQLRAADGVLALVRRQRDRAGIAAEVADLGAESERLTAAMADRRRRRTEALAAAPMPVEGLGVAVREDGSPYLTWEGLPFDADQISTAAQLRVSTAIGMAANPQLRVLRIKDGSLLDEDALAAIEAMARDEDFQVFVEVVDSSEGVGIIMRDGAVVGGTLARAPEPSGQPEEEQKAAEDEVAAAGFGRPNNKPAGRKGKAAKSETGGLL
jgi:hypothetical protein